MSDQPARRQHGPTGDDAQCVRLTLGGDRTAFATLYDRYAPLVRAVCYAATLNVTTAQDLAQETFLRAYRKLSDLREPGRFAAWLIAIARRVCQEWRRGRGRQKVAESLSRAGEVPGPQRGGEAASELLQAVASLPEDERLAVHLFYLDEEPADTARAVMGLSRSGFYKLLDRARQRLRSTLSEEEAHT